jgi:Tol biopolymer transport system component
MRIGALEIAQTERHTVQASNRSSPLDGHDGVATCAALLRAGRRLVGGVFGFALASAPGHAQLAPDTSCLPVWSPRGDRIAFRSNRDGHTAVYLMDTLGRHIERLTRDTVWTSGAAWSPDASRLVVSRGPSGDRHLFTIASDGSDMRQLTTGAGNAHFPSWSADGRTILFNWDVDGKRQIYRVAAGGGAPVRLTNDPANADLAKWGPGDTIVVFDSHRSGRWEVFSMRPDGSAQHRLAFGAIPVFAPDGRRILFQASPTDRAINFFTMSPDGSAVHQLTFGEHQDLEASYSPDGRSIVFCSNRREGFAIFRMRADGRDIAWLNGGSGGPRP